jgi:hypothetical protein
MERLNQFYHYEYWEKIFSFYKLSRKDGYAKDIFQFSQIKILAKNGDYLLGIIIINH